ANRIDDRLVGLLAEEMDAEQFERQRRRRGYRQWHNQGDTKQSPAVAARARVIAMRLFPGGSHYSKLTANPEIGIKASWPAGSGRNAMRPQSHSPFRSPAIGEPLVGRQFPL